MIITNNYKKKNLNVPNLRFPEFTGEWKKCIVGAFGKVVTGNTPPTKDVDNYTNGLYLWASPSDLGKVKYVSSTQKMLSEKGFSKTRIISTNSILITCIGSTIGKMGMAKCSMSTNQQINSLIPNNNHNCDFVYYSLQSNFPRYLSSIAVQAVPIISKSTFEQLCNFTTGIKEQKKIGYFLKLLDERIETQNKVIEDLKKLKSAIDEIEFNNSQWEAYTYRQLLNISNERNNNLRYLKVLSASQKFGMIERNELNIDIKYDITSIGNYKIVQKGDYVLHLRSFQGGFAFSEQEGVCSPAYIILRPNKHLYNGFFKDYFMSRQFINSLRIVTYGIRDGRSINVDEFLSLEVRVPSLTKQSKIVSRLNLISAKIQIEEELLRSYQRQKQYLLSQMFI